MKSAILSFIFALFFLSLQAQFIDESLKNYGTEYLKTNYKNGKAYQSLKNYDKALPLFLDLDTKFPNNPNIKYQIGVCYIHSTQQKTKAIPFLEMAINHVSPTYTGECTDTTVAIFAFYYLGKAYHLDNKIEEAIENFEKFKFYLKRFYTGKDRDVLLKDANRQIEMCYNAKKLMQNPLNITITNVGRMINTPYHDYSPIVSSDGNTLIFTSRRPSTTGGFEDASGKFFEDIYISKKNALDSSWSPTKNIGTTINTEGHEAALSLSADGSKLLIYHDDNGDGNIYMSELIEKEWSTPNDLGIEINTTAWETHACLSPDNNTLYFVSDRKGGYGGRDIWAADRLASGGWSKPRNVGPRINTELDEESPFLLPDGATLYFSSKGHESMGGFDIFISKLSKFGVWSEPENIGYPINSTDDDVFYMPTSDGKSAYYSTETSGGYGGQDIYKITIVKEKKRVGIIKGIVFDSDSYLPINAKIQVKNTEGDILASLVNNPTNGEYYVTLPLDASYDFIVNANDYYLHKETIKLDQAEVNKAIMLTRTPVRESFTTAEIQEITTPTFEEGLENFKPDMAKIGDNFILNNVHFDTDKATIQTDSYLELNNLIKFLTEHPTIKIEIAGYSDNTGDETKNKLLSEERAKACTSYLIYKGISIKRMKYRGYGSANPLLSNDTEEGRQVNRRVEVKIIGL